MRVPLLADALRRLRIAVTGGDGFLGRSLLHALKALGASVIRIDGDVRKAHTWEADFDVLYHFAAAMPSTFEPRLHDGFSVNVAGVLQALGACRSRGARLVFPSTCGVYQPRNCGPLSEDHPVDPQTAYDESKRIGELLCESYASHCDVPCTLFRLFNVYGPGQKEHFLVPYLILSGLRNGVATIYNTRSSRDFLYITDATEAFLHAVLDTKEFSIYNVGSGRPCTVGRITELIGDRLGRRLVWRPGFGKPDPKPTVYSNIDRAAEELGWRPEVSLEDGLALTVMAMSRGQGARS